MNAEKRQISEGTLFSADYLWDFNRRCKIDNIKTFYV